MAKKLNEMVSDAIDTAKEMGAMIAENVPTLREADQLQETPLHPYDRVRLTFDDGTFENCFYVSEGVYSKANSAGNAFKVGSPREGVVSIEKI